MQRGRELAYRVAFTSKLKLKVHYLESSRLIGFPNMELSARVIGGRGQMQTAICSFTEV
jgi:hypothetical protein